MAEKTNSYSLTKALIVWGLGALLYFYQFIMQVSPNFMAQQLMKEFSVNAETVGTLTAYFFYVFAAMQIPVGILLERFGARALLTFAAITCATSALIFGTASNFHVIQIARIVLGFGASFVTIGGLYLVWHWFKPNLFAFFLGLQLTMGMAGAIGGEAPLSMLITLLGWRHVFVIFSVIGYILAILIFIIVRNDPKEKIFHVDETYKSTSIFQELKYIISLKQNWLLAIYAALIYAVFVTFSTSWGASFFEKLYHLSETQTGFDLSFMLIGLATGSPFFGWLSDKIGKRKPPIYISVIGMLLTSSYFLYGPIATQSILCLLLFAFGFLTGGAFVSYTNIREVNPPQYNGIALGFMNMINMIPPGMLAITIGKVLDWKWNGQMDQGVRVYTESNFHIAMGLTIACLIISLFMSFFIKETNCKGI